MRRALPSLLVLLLGSSAYAVQSDLGATVTGIVVDDRNQPIPRAGVALIDAASAPVRSVSADDSGRFEINTVRPTALTLIAWHSQHIAAALGERQARRVGISIPFRVGERRHFTVRLARAGVITGVVRDPDGEPIRGALVHAVPIRSIAGRRVPDYRDGTGATTNSRGEYRIFGVDGRDHLVAANDSESWVNLAESATTAAPRTRRVVPVFFPDADDPARADVLRVSPGEIRTGIDLQLRRVSTGRVSVTLVNPTGINIDEIDVTLDDQELGSWLAPYSPSVSIDGANASLELTGLPAGAHHLAIRANLVRSPSRQVHGPLWARTEVTIGDRPANLTLALESSATLTLRWTFAGPSPLPDRRDMNFLAAPDAERLPHDGMYAYATDDNSATFGVPAGRYRLRAPVLRGWTLKSAMLGNRDLTDSAFDLPHRDELDAMSLIFTDRGPVLTGAVADADGVATFDAVVVVAPASRRDWRTGSRRIRVEAPDVNGRFTIRGLPAGEYVIAAMRDDVAEETLTPELLDRLLTSAARVNLLDGEMTTKDLRLSRSQR